MEKKTVVQEARFDYKGYPCVVLFLSMGHRCGYVGLPKSNKYYKKHYDNINIDCHGGLTYSESTLITQSDTETWWIGFDTAHCFDKNDFKKAKEYFADDAKVRESICLMEALEEMYDTGGEIRTLEYCMEECKRIVDQVIELQED